MESSWPRILYLCNFPPSNLNGGSILIGRLLSGYPPEKLTAITSSQCQISHTPNDGWASKHVVFPALHEKGRWGISRLKVGLNLLLIPVVAAYAIRTIKKRSAAVIVSVAEGSYFLAAALAAAITSIPFVLIVHDDWVSELQKSSYVLRYFCRPLFRAAVRIAAHVYAISEPMQQLLQDQYGVRAELQMPSAEPCAAGKISSQRHDHESRILRIVYAGNCVAARDSLDMLLQIVEKSPADAYETTNCELHLYVPDASSMRRQVGFRTDRVIVHDWVHQDQLRSRLSAADVLYLPYTFRADEAFITATSFPAKIADYLSVGKPILIAAPANSTIVAYARRFQFAEVVTEPNNAALAAAVSRLARSPAYRSELGSNALRAFEINHNVVHQRETLRDLLLRLPRQQFHSS